MNEAIECIKLYDRHDRLGSNLSWYISTILVAVKNKYKICFIKPKNEYKYYNSIFVELLFEFIDEYNDKYFENTQTYKNNYIIQESNYFKRIIKSVKNLKCDWVSIFKEYIFKQDLKDKLNKLAKIRNYNIPYDTEKSIVVHLRLDDRRNTFINYEKRLNCSKVFKNIVDNDDTDYYFDCFGGQSAIKEEEIQIIIDKALNIYKDYEVIIITNGKHNLPYKTISNDDETYDLYLLCNSKVLIGSMSTFSFTAILFGNHKYIFYPLWEHIVSFGLTTKYDKTNFIEFF